MVVYQVVLSLLFAYPSAAVIYQLNSTEYARMPPLFALDEHEVCLSRPRGLFCLVRLNLFDDGDNPLMHLIHISVVERHLITPTQLPYMRKEYSDDAVRHYNHTSIERGVCLQDTCGHIDISLTGEALTRALGECLNNTFWQEYGLQANVSKLYYCDRSDESDEITTLDWTVMAVFTSIVLINLVASFYDYAINCSKENSKAIGNKYILSFSIIRNYEWLTTFDHEKPKLQTLQFIHCIRVIANFLIMMVHAMLPIAIGYTSNPHDFEKMYDYVFYQIVFNGLMIVQIFFFSSGFLLAYHFLIYSEKVKVTWLAIPKVTILRCCRLSPALAVVLAFTVTWLRHLGSGPLWKLNITSSVVADCRTYWWYHLLYINNYAQGDKYCAIPTWYVAADSQVFLVGLIACVATVHHGRRLTLSVLLLVGTAIPALQVWLQDLDGVPVLGPEFYRTLENKTFRDAHVGGHSNLQCYVAGMLVAHLVYRWQEKGVDLSKNRYYSVVFWLSPPVITLMFYSGHSFYSAGARASLPVRMFYASAHKLGMAAIGALFWVGMVLKAPSFIRNIAEWRAWTVPSRLSYCVYLLHMNLIHILIGKRTELAPVSFYNMTITHFGVVLLTYMIALPFYLMVEAPCNRLMKVLLEPMKTDLIQRKAKQARL